MELGRGLVLSGLLLLLLGQSQLAAGAKPRGFGAELDATGDSAGNYQEQSAGDLLESIGELTAGKKGLAGALFGGTPAKGLGQGEPPKTEGPEQTFDLEPVREWLKLALNPAELVRAIGRHFKLDPERFVAAVGTGLVFGLESAMTPLVVTLKVVERVFVPNVCRLRFICRMGSHLEFVRENVLRFSPNFLEGSSQVKAFAEGVAGRDCEVLFPCAGAGEPKLRKQFEELKQAQNPEANYLNGAPAKGSARATKELKG